MNIFVLKYFSSRLLQKQPLYNLFGIPIQVTRNVPGIFYNFDKKFHSRTINQSLKAIAAYFWTHQRCDNRHLSICRKPGFGYHSRSQWSAKEERRSKKQNNWNCPNGYKLFSSFSPSLSLSFHLFPSIPPSLLLFVLLNEILF